MSIKRTIITTILALALVAISVPGITQADQISDLLAQIQALTAQINALQNAPATTQVGTGFCTGVSFATNLNIGSTGSDVKCLQSILNSTGIAQTVTGTFGPHTLAGVKAFQTKNGILASGNVGPLTRAKLNAALTTITPGTGTTVPPVTTTGAVTATLASTTPAAGAIIGGQATASMLDFNLIGTGTVTSVTLQRTGYSDQNLFTNVYLFDGATRITDGYSFNANGQIVINGLSIAVNGTKVISVKGDVMAAASATQGSAAVGLIGFTANGSAKSASVTGNMMSVISGSTATVQLNGANSVTGTPTINAGTMGYTFWSAPVLVNTRAVMLKTANFRMIGSAPSDALSNIRMYIDGSDTGKVATVIAINGSNYASFDFTSAPITMTTGSHTVDMRADVQKGSSRTIQVSVQQASDFTITDPQVGVNIALGNVNVSADATAASVSIGTGTITLIADPTFQSMTTITGGSSNVAVAKFKLHAYGEDIKISTLPITVALSTAATPAGIQNVTIYANGQQIGSQVSISSGTAYGAANCTTAGVGWTCYANSFNLGSQLIVTAGTDTVIEVRADLRNTAGANYTAGTINGNVTAGGTGTAQSSQNTVTLTALTGNVLAIQTGTLSLSKNTSYANTQTVTANTPGVKVASFNLQNLSTSESVRITGLTITGLTAGGSLVTDYSSIKTSETSGNAGVAAQPAITNSPTNTTFSNTYTVSRTLAPNESTTIDVLMDANSVPNSGTIAVSMSVTARGVSSNVVADQGPVAGQTGIAYNTATIATPTLATDSTLTSAGQYVAAATSTAIGATKQTFNFVSSNGTSTIKALKFVVTGAGTVDSIKVGDSGTYRTVQSVGGVETVSVSDLNIAVANSGSGLNLPVYVSYSAVGNNGVASASTSKISLAYIEYQSGNTNSKICTAAIATAWSVVCGTTITNVDANQMVMVGSKPSFSVGSSSDTLSNSLVKIAEFTVTADTHGDIKLGNLPISVTSSGVVTVVSGANNIIVKDTNNTVIATTNTGLAVSLGGTGTDTIIFGTTSATSFTIAAGSSKVFRVYTTPATVFGAVNTTSLSTKLGVPANVQWYDVAGSNTTAFAATNTANLYGYPVDTSVIHN